jgi:hypothetical protein
MFWPPTTLPANLNARRRVIPRQDGPTDIGGDQEGSNQSHSVLPSTAILPLRPGQDGNVWLGCWSVTALQHLEVSRWMKCFFLAAIGSHVSPLQSLDSKSQALNAAGSDQRQSSDHRHLQQPHHLDTARNRACPASSTGGCGWLQRCKSSPTSSTTSS